MLKSVEIKKLYGLYSYSMDFRPERKPYCFVTGPNAYGKTSLLKMLDSLYKQSFAALSNIVFDGLMLCFDDGFHIEVNQGRTYDETGNSDDVLPTKVVLNFTYSYGENETETTLWESDKAETEKLNNMTAYLASHPIYHITDNRLYVGGAKKPIEDSLRDYLQELARELNAALQQGMMEEREPITEAYYKEKMSWLQPLIESMIKYELVRTTPVPAYSEEKSAFCHTCIMAVENAIQGELLDRIARLDALSLIVDNYGFAKKQLELSPYFGFRFRADDEMGSLLSFEQLSSGERHIILMNCDILFDVNDDSLVLIDEPELSFHLEWQGQFMNNLDELTGVRKDLQYIICTHAPEVFGYEWDLSVDLKEQSEK